MAKKKPAKSWTPDSPLKVDWSKVPSKTVPGGTLADGLEHVDNPGVNPTGNPQQLLKPANHKSHIRQKKV